MQKRERQQTIMAGGALLSRLKAIGVDYIFANSGTDFPPIIEGLASALAKGYRLPISVVAPHEHAAVGMAHGYYLATGRPQAVMAHTNVGLANCAIGAINAAIEHVPVLLFSGRTPTTEQGRFGARTVPIGWGQEMRDQTALVREASKWDYELRFPEQVGEIVDRAYAIAASTPKGPVYMSLPRELLCEPCPVAAIDEPPSIAPAIAAPRAEDVDRAAEILTQAERPVIFAQRGAGSREAFAALAKLADAWAIPVVQYWAIQLAIPTGHPMSAGIDPEPWISEADAILVIDCTAPWSPDVHRPKADCRIIHMGPDPLFSRLPVRNFRSDLSIVGETQECILALARAMKPGAKQRQSARAKRRELIAARNVGARSKAMRDLEASGGRSLTKAWVSYCLSAAIKGENAVVLSELGCPLAALSLEDYGSWYQEPHSGGLGWSFPCALGMQLADRDRLIVATMGDGSYMFANPVACHQIAESLRLPVLVIVLNNLEWGAVRQSVSGLYPDGFAVRANEMPLTSLAPSPDFVKVAEASRAWAARVEDGNEVLPTLKRAIAHIRSERSLALVEVRVAR
jgi:acetolactate synthase-1/2/3 large subunit